MIGIDIVSIPRIKTAIDKYGDKFLQKFLNKEEMQNIKNAKNAAGHWAAKEACAKALGCGICERLSFHDMTITKTAIGAPYIMLNPRSGFGIDKIYTSITHDGDFAVAVALIK